jgi:hypothetical protein
MQNLSYIKNTKTKIKAVAEKTATALKNTNNVNNYSQKCLF